MKALSTILLVCLSFISLFAQDLIPKDWPHLKGYWKFQNAKDLTKATVGNKLNLVGTHQQVLGASAGDTAIRIGVGSYYKYPHNIAPNGGGDSVNQYTLMFDFKVLNFKQWHTFFQTDTTNKNDGECFIRPITSVKPARIGTATTGYTPDSILENKWYRLVISVNLNNFFRYYLNGKLVLEGDTQEVDGRFALLPQILFFADNDKEDDTIDIASLAIFDTCMSAKQIAKIGSIDPCDLYPARVNLGRDTVLCADESISLSAGTGYASYQWSTGNKLPSEYINSDVIGIGKKAVWVKIIDNRGCKAGDTINITYLPLPAVNLGVDTSICDGQTVKLKAGTDMSYKYAWKKLPQNVTISTSNTITVNASTIHSVKVTSTNGCINTDTITVIVNSKPMKPKINIIGNTSLCKGDSVKLEGPGSFIEYNWSNGYKFQHQFVKKNAVLVLKVKDQNGCESPNSDSIKVIVHNIPSAPVIQYQGSTDICTGDSLVLNVTAGYKQYIWQDGLGSSVRIVRSPTIYSVYVKDSNNCVSAVSNEVFVSLLQSPPKPSIVLNGKSSLCEGESTKLSATQTFSGYLWTDSSKTKEIEIKKGGNYSIKIFGNNACSSVWSDPISIIVNPIPSKPTVAVGVKDSLKCYTLAERYKWRRNSVQIADTTKSIYSINSGNFQVQIANKGCWSKFSDSLYFKNLGIKSALEMPLKLQIIPNPTTDLIEVRIFTETSSSNMLLQLCDMQGKMVMETKKSGSDLQAGITLNLNTLTKGIYILKISGNGLLYSGRIEKL